MKQMFFFEMKCSFVGIPIRFALYRFHLQGFPIFSPGGDCAGLSKCHEPTRVDRKSREPRAVDGSIGSSAGLVKGFLIFLRYQTIFWKKASKVHLYLEKTKLLKAGEIDSFSALRTFHV